ncbi:NRAMP family divalent metal transporter [Clostridium uliginosum]|uniref:Mn2+ and Fe2+ transporters of the NRAMP family n=1 Tax=Clostridium uliginosum TaxID=119641 RepID=A0A1I1HWZ0_9CLOT|nr:divalent metal cation transporter [Clostridium uliginosum]SFC28295.1 Mn2+ and Fe2+ transporters of the NRAMP family [Clostridium uliginosum]
MKNTSKENLISKENSKFNQLVEEPNKGFRKRMILLWALIGPGVVAALADNDAGGIISYALTGTQFGISFFIPLTFCLIIITYTVQEMSMRLGVVAQEGYTKLVRKHYGKGWMIYHIVALLIENLITLLTEFIGMSCGLVILGLPLWVSVLISLLLVLSITIFAGYWAKERLSLLIGIFNIGFIVTAFITRPSFASLSSAFLNFSVPHGSNNIVFYVIALIGNAVAPWMIFYQNSAYIDKGVTSNNIRLGRYDTLIGSIFQVFIAACIIIIGACLFNKIPNLADAGPAEIIKGLNSILGFTPALIFALGLFNAGLLASITVGLSSAWSVAEAFGWKKSLNNKVTEAPKFYAVYFISVILAAIGVLIPNLPLNFISIVAQILGGILMAPILIFLAFLTSNEEVMGNYKNSLFANIRAWITVILLIGIGIITMVNIILGIG